MEKLTDTKIEAECMKLIRDRLKNKNLPQPSKFYCSRWNSNEFIKGAYSFTSRKTDHLNGWETILSQPILDKTETNVVMLAGEHCHQQFFSTVHGAFISGIEQAEKILKIRSDATKTFQTVSCVSKLWIKFILLNLTINLFMVCKMQIHSAKVIWVVAVQTIFNSESSIGCNRKFMTFLPS